MYNKEKKMKFDLDEMELKYWVVLSRLEEEKINIIFEFIWILEIIFL